MSTNNAQQLAALLKSARNIMRKDKGLSTDLDRLPLLTWLMFLKFLDDLEQVEESKALLSGGKYQPTLDAPYRWRDWAAQEDGSTGSELLDFINDEEAVLPDSTRGPGLLAYLRGLQPSGSGDGTDKRRTAVATVFSGIESRMRSGYLLRDVINAVSGIHFLSRDELFTLGHIYESMLREMRDAAGDNGEFYTPRPVVRFMVETVDPQLGETVLDPACGTGGFLVDAFIHLETQARTVADRATLQDMSIFGGEAKPLPYLLCEMNLLLHGVDAPSIDPGNSLRFCLAEIGDRDRYDVIVTNPPFGGEEERGILANFPADMQATETTLLFLQLIMHRLARPSADRPTGGRAAVVVPNGTLFADGMAARVKAKLLSEFNLHTVVRLPEGVFSPYTDIPTNILFFDHSGPTDAVWFYQVDPPVGRKRFTKTNQLKSEHLQALASWWKTRGQTDSAWLVPVSDIIVRNSAGAVTSVNLDINNPARLTLDETRPPREIIASLRERQASIERLLLEFEAVVGDDL